MNSANLISLLSVDDNSLEMTVKSTTTNKSVVDLGDFGCWVHVEIYIDGEYWGGFSTWHADGCKKALQMAVDILDDLGI